jgi:hypothetical protein
MRKRTNAQHYIGNMGADVILLNIVLYSSFVFQLGCGAKNPPHRQYFNVGGKCYYPNLSRLDISLFQASLNSFSVISTPKELT